MATIHLGISTCPNDTFLFAPLLEGRAEAPGLDLRFELADVHELNEALAAGKLVILEIDVQGGLQIRQSLPDALLIFIKPPSEDVLLTRLQGRGRDDEQAIQSRYAEARSEIDKAETSAAYNVFVINDDLEKAIEETCDIIRRRVNTG